MTGTECAIQGLTALETAEERERQGDQWQAALSKCGEVLPRYPLSLSLSLFLWSASLQVYSTSQVGDPVGAGLLVQFNAWNVVESAWNPQSMRPFHNNIAQNYRVEGASPLWVEKRPASDLFCYYCGRGMETHAWPHKVRLASLGAR